MPSVVYDKKSDDSGYSETKAFALTEIPLFEEASVPQQTPQVPMTEYATKAELEDLKKFVEELMTNNA